MRRATPAFVLVLLLAPLTLAAVPPSSSGPILALFEPGDATLAGLDAAGFPSCAVNPAVPCYDAVTASQFATEALNLREAIFVGSQPDGAPSAVHAALVSRKVDLDAFVQGGGSLVALVDPNHYPYLPSGATVWSINGTNSWAPPPVGDEVHHTSWGAGHPVAAGTTNASLSNWGPSHQTILLDHPAWLGEVTKTYVSWDNESYQLPVTLAGNAGDGCVVVTAQPADRIAAGAGNASRSGDAADLIGAAMGWALDCTQEQLPPTPMTGAIVIASVNGNLATSHSSNLACGALVASGNDYSVTCVPAMQPPPLSSWACYGTSIAMNFQAHESMSGNIGCGNSVVGQCATTNTGTGGARTGACFATTNLALGSFPLSCRAHVEPLVSAPPVRSWRVACGSMDP